MSANNKVPFRAQDKRPYAISFKDEKTKTQQQFKKQCDINVIMAKYEKTGVVNVSDKKALYGDFANVPDYLEAFNTVKSAQDQFRALPGELRQKLDNSPAKFLEWAQDPSNKEDMIKYGLMDAPKPFPAPIPAPPVAEAGASTEPEPAPGA